MEITTRQGEILNRIVQEYINSAQPISSQLLEKKYDFDICPASIRIEMQKLTDKGFLSQPHTSAGRIPTDKGYRFFVDRLFEKEFEEDEISSDFEMDDWLEDEMQDTVKFIHILSRKAASVSQALVLNYLKNEKILWKEGWEEILKEPEFRKEENIIKLSDLLKDFEDDIEDLKINSGIQVFIGRENPLKKAKDFSIIISKYSLPHEGEGIISFLGLKRMDYDRNISLLNSITKIMESFN